MQVMNPDFSHPTIGDILQEPRGSVPSSPSERSWKVKVSTADEYPRADIVAVYLIHSDMLLSSAIAPIANNAQRLSTLFGL